jgi:hypothetical protein
MKSKVLVISTIDRVDGAAEFRALQIQDIESIVLTDLPFYPGQDTPINSSTQLLQALANLQAQISAVTTGGGTVTVGIVATTGGQSGSTPTNSLENFILTCPVNGGLQALPAIPNVIQRFHNNGANTCNLYPINLGTDSFVGLSPNQPIPIPPVGMLTIVCGVSGIFNYY